MKNVLIKIGKKKKSSSEVKYNNQTVEKKRRIKRVNKLTLK